jgi:hypothetical protein
MRLLHQRGKVVGAFVSQHAMIARLPSRPLGPSKFTMKQFLQQLKTRCLVVRKTQPPVLLFGLRRGGSTMVADAIAAAPGVWYADEPYAMFPGRPGYAEKVKHLPMVEHSHFFGLDGVEAQQFENFSHALLNAEFRDMGTCRTTKSVFLADRVALKILNAPWMIDWFATETDAQILPLLRHPGAQAGSVLRQGWEYPVRAYARRPDALARHFTSEQIETIEQMSTGPKSWELAILDWIVTSAPLRAFGARTGELAHYEDIVMDPAGFVDAVLVRRLKLGPRTTLLERLGRPSGSARMNEQKTNALIRDGNKRALVQKWRDGVDDEMLHQGQALLDRFEIQDYTFS